MYMDQLAMEEARIHKLEPDLLVKFVAEMSNCHSVLGVPLTLADKFAYAITRITAMYAEAIKHARGGWRCGTHINHVRTALSNTISSMYSGEELSNFMDFCICCTEGREFLQDADKETKDMVEHFLLMRPEPFVHPSAAWVRKVLQNEE